MPRIDRPNKAAIGRIAENQPDLLNLLVAYFVMEWQEVRIGNPAHGIDQTGDACQIPDYVAAWGVDACVHYLLRSPLKRRLGEPGYVTEWLREISG